MALDDWHLIYDFWFGEDGRGTAAASARMNKWFSKNPDFDREIREKFGPHLESFQPEDYLSWRSQPKSMLSLVILLDQFPRNAYRGTARMFAYDHWALAFAKEAVAKNDHQELAFSESMFLLMPYEHSESRADQADSLRLFTELAQRDPKAGAELVDYARRHKEIIDRFGRFPHRNQTLGRPSTPEELEFLTQPGSGF